MIRDLLLELKQEKKVYGQWKQKPGDMGGIQRCCCHSREKINVSKAQLGLMQARNTGDNKKSFIKYASSKGSAEIT